MSTSPRQFAWSRREMIQRLGGGLGSIATVSLYVRPTKLPLIVNDDFYVARQNTVLEVPAPGVLGNDYVLDVQPARTSWLVTGVYIAPPTLTATLLTGVCPHGQGLETSLAQLVADQLGLPMEDIRVVYGDTAVAPYSSTGTIASRSMAVGGGATVRAAVKIRNKLLQFAGHLLEASPDDLELIDRSVRVRGEPHSALPIRTIAEKAWLGWDLPEGLELGLEERDIHDPQDISYSYATHAAAIAVDTETGEIEIERYVVVHDCGVMVNPMIVEGQIHGGVAQGLGGALSEEMIYGEDGQPLTTTYMDYLIPTSAEVPDMLIEHLEIPSPFIPGGMKGMGEGGTIAPAAALGNALADAIPEIAQLVTETPLTPTMVWRWIHSARKPEE